MPLARKRHRGGHGANREQSASEADQNHADTKQGNAIKRGSKQHRRKGCDAGNNSDCREPVMIHPLSEPSRRECKSHQGSSGQHRRQRGRLADRQTQNFTPIGLQQNILHAEGCSADTDHDQRAPR